MSEGQPTLLLRGHGTMSMMPRSMQGTVGSSMMGWSRIDEASPPIGRPVLVRTVEGDAPVVAFLSPEKIWYSGGALVQNSMTLLGATPTEWCEPDGEERL